MKMMPAIFLLSLLGCCKGYSQPVIKGRVVAAGDGMPVIGSSVFISNTSRGTTSDKNGYFEITGVPPGQHELIVSNIGYETTVFSFSTEQLPLQLRVELSVKIKELRNVTVEPSIEEGWDKWGSLFINNFIGQAPNARFCKIKNERAIKFRYYKKTNRVTAYADEALLLENKALGYRIVYQLEDFEVNFNTHTSLFSGYPLFEELEKSRKRWKRNRDKAYYGSMSHFMYCLYHGTLQAAGYEVRRMMRVPNEEKERVKQVYDGRIPNKGDTVQRPSQDSVEYYERILRQEDYKEIYGRQLLTADSLVIEKKGNYKSIFFNDYLYIVYKNEIEDEDYLLFQRERRSRTFQRSYIKLADATPVIIDINGNYYPPQEVFAMAYWGWSEKMADCLPIDYIPSKD